VHCNVVTLVGRVSQAGPELSYASSGTPVCSLVVEVDEFGPGDKIFTSWLPVRTTGKHAEQTSVDLEPGDIVMVSGKLKYESSVDKQTQQKTSKLIISSWGIQQRQPAQDDSASGGSVSQKKGQPRSFNLSQLERRLPLRQGVRAFRKSPSVLGCLKGSSAKTNGGIMKLRKRRPSVPSNVSDPTPPRFWPGDPIVAIDDGTPGRVEFARHDGTCCIVWDKSGKREWVHEDTIAWPASFQPTRRR
jgi:single-stranded DNA-binding protein